MARAGHRPPGGGLCAGIDLAPVAFPQIRVVRPCKLPFTLDEARQIVAAADRFPRRCGRSDWPAVWRGLLSALYVTGHRIGTVLAVERSMFRPMGTDYQLHLPAALVPKTGKAAVQRVPAWCAGAILALPGHRPLSLGIDRRHLARLHAELQRLAGVAPLSWQAWRRTHAAMMQRLGLGFALNCAAASLQHSDWRTTATHYWDITEEVRLRLPPLWD